MDPPSPPVLLATNTEGNMMTENYELELTIAYKDGYQKGLAVGQAMPTGKDRRNRIAEGFAFALATRLAYSYDPDEKRAEMCRMAVKLAGSLIEELDK
jgi:hypothetical protein